MQKLDNFLDTHMATKEELPVLMELIENVRKELGLATLPEFFESIDYGTLSKVDLSRLSNSASWIAWRKVIEHRYGRFRTLSY